MLLGTDMESVDRLHVALYQRSDIMHVSMSSQQGIHGASSLCVGKLWLCSKSLCEERYDSVTQNGTESLTHRETNGSQTVWARSVLARLGKPRKEGIFKAMGHCAVRPLIPMLLQEGRKEWIAAGATPGGTALRREGARS